MQMAKRGSRSSGELVIALLGRFRVLLHGNAIPDEAWGRQKTKTLLKVLLTDPGRTFTQDELIEALFPGAEPRRALTHLYGRISQLRRVLQPELSRGRDSRYILLRGQGYCFNSEATARIDTA